MLTVALMVAEKGAEGGVERTDTHVGGRQNGPGLGQAHLTIMRHLVGFPHEMG